VIEEKESIYVILEHRDGHSAYCSVPVRPEIEHEAVYHLVNPCDAIGSCQ
jgi:hypothetical protein